MAWNIIISIIDVVDGGQSPNNHSNLGNHYNTHTGDIDMIKRADGAYQSDHDTSLGKRNKRI